MQELTPSTTTRGGHRTRRLALFIIAVIVVAGTVTAFVQSYEGLYGWANRYLSEGWARTWPLQVDAWIAVGELALYIGYRDGWPARRKIWPWVAVTTGLAASTGFNVGHLAATDLPGRLTAAVPPVAAFGGLFIGLQVLKYIEDASQVAADRRRVPVAAPSAWQQRLWPLTGSTMAEPQVRITHMRTDTLLLAPGPARQSSKLLRSAWHRPNRRSPVPSSPAGSACPNAPADGSSNASARRRSASTD